MAQISNVLGHAGKVVKDYATGSAAIAHTFIATVPCKLSHVSVHYGTQPITSENLVVTIDQGLGAAYDIVCSTTDPSSAGDLFYQPTEELFLQTGDAVTITYTNTDGRTYGSIVCVKEFI